MEQFPLFALAIVVAALFSYWNHRYLGLPTTIGVMVIALVGSLALLLVDATVADVRTPATRYLESLRFRETLLDGMLAFLLFAGALHVDLGRLWGQKRLIGLLATVGVVVTTFLVAGLIWWVARPLGLELSFPVALVFGALISPTDPIAVMGILRQAGVPKSLETKIVGESLFNDGIGVVVFTVLLGLAGGGTVHVEPTAAGISLFLAQEVLGAVVLGFAGGYLVYRMMRSVESHKVEVLLTLALAWGLYVLAQKLHCAGPLAVVVAGLMIGNSGRHLAMGDEVRERVDTFWELVDEILNVLLFVLIGLELLVLDLSPKALLAGVVAIPIALFGRFLAVGGAVSLLARFRTFTPGAIPMLTWGGLRGGISVALALWIDPTLPGRELVLTMTYVVVVFSILVQGLTVGILAKRVTPTAPAGHLPPVEPH